jgi:hypothetical protein
VSHPALQPPARKLQKNYNASIFLKKVFTKNCAIVFILQMNTTVSQRRRGVSAAAGGRDRIECIHFLKRTLRDIAPLNKSCGRVLELVESAFGPEVLEMELTVAERRFLLDTVHLLISLLQEWWERNPEVVESLQGKLNDLAMRYEACPA